MSAPKHTPGPWARVMNEPETVGRIETRDGVKVIRFIATVEGDFGEWADEGDAEAEANARLIAAAPELSDALKTLALVAGIEAAKHGGQGGPLKEALSAARAALAKARGES